MNKMPLSTDISTALHLLEHVQERVEDCDDPKLQMHTTQDIKSLISLLEDPVFRSIVTIQDSLIELNNQLGQHPSIIPGDFDINISGQLELSVPTTPVQPLGSNVYQDLYQDSSELEDQRVPVTPLVHSSSEDTSAQVNSPSLVSEVMGMPPITTTTYAKEFKKVIEAAARGRQIFTVQLYKPEGTSLGFSVVGLRSKDKGELGIFLQEIQPNGIAGCDGRLVEGDQILAIDGQPLDSNISHEQAISILQKARGLVELVVARSAQDVGSSLQTDELSGASSSTAAAGAGVSIIGGVVGGTTNQTISDKDQSVSTSSIVTAAATSKSSQPVSTTSAATPTPTPPTSTPVPGGLVVERSPSAVSDASKSGSDMVLNTEWAQVEVINLINDGSGLGFGIVGGRSTGVVVKTILPGGVADRDNRLQSGDHILQIGDVNLRGMGSEQVAAVLRQSGTHVRLVVARPVEPTSPDYQALGSHAPIVPTKILGDPDELDRHLVHSVPETYNMRHVQGDATYDNGYMYSQESDVEMHARPGLIMDVVRNPMPIGAMPVIPTVPVQIPELPVLTMDTIDVNSLPEMERFTVELKKDIYGLGITIAGYVCEKEELSGIFVKSISEGSAADLSNKIQINDRIVEVDGHSLQGYSNHEAVEVLRRTGQTVVLCLERYLRGPKYEQLQQAIAASELRLPQPSSPSITSLPSFPISADGETTTEIEPEGESHTTVDSAVLQEGGERERVSEELDDAANVEALLSDPSSELTPQIRAAIKAKWQKIVGPDTEIVVAQLKKFTEGSGLGISLEGTVDVENGQEVRPHHYIRSILPEGPVGQNGTLRSGDELLEVNGYRLLGINHMEVVSVLKELPIHVRMVCGRNIASQDPLCPIDTAQHQAAFQTRSILGGSLQNLLPTMDRLVKAKSDGSLASTTTTATVTDASLNKMKSRSLEPLTGLAMWSSEPQIIELVKGERGLGFSILDYQDPMNPNETVIVIRSLVPGGVAQVDGQLIPGDRLLFVNDIALENATLDQAVQALKGAPKGTVRIGVAKPLPIPDSIVQRVPPICPVRRSKSFPNESETTDHAAELEDFLSSRSVQPLSKAIMSLLSGVTELSMDKPETDEEDEHWKDASPHTPTCSPTKRLTKLPTGPRSTKTVEVDIHEFQPTSPLHEKDVIILESGASPPSRKLAMKYSQDVAPKVKLKAETEPKVPEAPKPPERSVSERRRSLRRMDSEERMSSSRETLNKSDLTDKGARKKIFKKKDERRPSRRKDDSIETYVDAEDSRRRREPEEVVTRTREERKSLREQECIERVTEFLTKHSVLCYSEGTPVAEAEISLQGPPATSERPTTLKEPEEPPGHAEEPPGKSEDGGQRLRDEKTPEEPLKTPSSIDSEKPPGSSATVVDVAGVTSPERPPEEPKTVTSPETEVAPVKRKSSMRKKPATFSRESSRESLLDDAKKEVRIQENVEEIFFEDVSEQVTAVLPEVQLVKARIITAEEAVANRAEEPQTRIEIHSPPEVATVPDSVRVKSGRVPSPETVNMSQLQLVSLAKSTSENTLVETEDKGEDYKISVRNIKAEILLDLSKVPDAGDEMEDSVDGERKDRKLSRTGSEGSKRAALRAQTKIKERDGFMISSLAQPDEPELTILLENAAIERRKILGEEEMARDERPQEEAGSRRLAEEVELPRQQPQEDRKADYDRIPDPKHPLEDLKPEEDSLISKEHSLEYQSQTLESQTELLLQPVQLSGSLEERGVPDRWPGPLEEERSFKETQYSPKEKLDAETQTQQETKSTQCSPEQSIGSPDLPKGSPLRVRGFYQSPRREVHTQTQGESKSVQCCLDELGGLSRTPDLDDSFDSPSKSEKESKSIQCIPKDFSDEDRSPRKEVEVQTYQESKAVQCSDDELLEAEQLPRRSKTDSSASSSCGSPCKLNAVVFVEEPVDMTVTQRDHDGNVSWSKHWGPERLVEIFREPKTSLGLSIVGGKVDLHNGSSSKSQNISGIFIKNVLPNSPAGRTGELKIGDRIIEVDGVDLRHSTHERAVEVIQAAGNPVRLLVQSLVHLNNENDTDGQTDEGGRLTRKHSGRNRSGAPTGSFGQRTSPVRSTTPEATQGSDYGERQSSSRSDFRRQSTRASDGAGSSSRRSSMKKSIRKKAPSPPSNPGILREVSEEKEDHASKPEEPPRRKYSSDESSEEEDTRELEGNVYTKAGMEISRKSAGNVKRSKAEIEADPEQEDEYGYTNMKVQKKYHALGHKVLMVKVEKDRRGLGISLAGHKDRNRMAVFICGLNPKGSAHKGGELVVGDEILEVNGRVLQGRCHLNASAMIKGMAGTSFKIVVLRRSKALDDLAVKPIVQFPPSLEENTFNQYKGVRNIPVKKGQYGLGIMIIEGKHAEVGQGIFISDIQEGSAAEQAGLNVGDMILAVNMDCLLGSTYDEATSLLKKAEGVVTLTVCNPNQSKVAKEEEDRAKGIIPEEKPPAPKEPEKPKEPEPPSDPKDCKIVTGKDTTIEFQKEKDKGIGFTIAGGSDTPLKKVFILEVFPDGAAGKDGRLQSGDEILDMCNKSFKEIEHEKAHAAVLKASGTIVMVVHRQEKPEEEIEVELQKKSGKGAGLCLTGYKSGKGAYVSDLIPGGSALECGKICKGDRVVAVGGQDVREAPVEDIAVHVKVSNPVQLKLARFKSAKQ
ncbi:multiple PDZ domain protein isoform X1 [Megachile rotundata]|uniref:multiple PDZ domain protein isoform X1 n=1 Tax=Megachile rotundata TaxID=143995 RepID=UPI003FD0E0DE